MIAELRPHEAAVADPLWQDATVQGREQPAPAATRHVGAGSARHEAVERVIQMMHARLGEPLSLRDMAETAIFSPYHFDRMFRKITGVPPGKFLTMLRMEAAKRLLFTTQLRATDVCFEVGYSSIGTFTTHFTQLVGLSPLRLRRLVSESDIDVRFPTPFGSAPCQPEGSPSDASGATLDGSIYGASAGLDVIFVGLFQTPIPHGRPTGCALLSETGPYRIKGVPDGRYHLLAAALRRSRGAKTHLLPGYVLDSVGAGRAPIDIQDGRACGQADLWLRPPHLTDPPILIALPLLLAEAGRLRPIAPDAVANGGWLPIASSA